MIRRLYGVENFLGFLSVCFQSIHRASACSTLSLAMSNFIFWTSSRKESGREISFFSEEVTLWINKENCHPYLFFVWYLSNKKIFFKKKRSTKLAYCRDCCWCTLPWSCFVSLRFDEDFESLGFLWGVVAADDEVILPKSCLRCRFFSSLRISLKTRRRFSLRCRRFRISLRRVAADGDLGFLICRFVTNNDEGAKGNRNPGTNTWTGLNEFTRGRNVLWCWTKDCRFWKYTRFCSFQAKNQPSIHLFNRIQQKNLHSFEDQKNENSKIVKIETWAVNSSWINSIQ